MRVLDDRDDESVFDSDRHTDVDFGWVLDVLRENTTIDAGFVDERERDCAYDEVVDGDSTASCDQLRSEAESRRDVDTDSFVKVRDRLFRMAQSLGDRRAHTCEFNLRRGARG